MGARTGLVARIARAAERKAKVPSGPEPDGSAPIPPPQYERGIPSTFSAR
jgi:hypothetical protein